MQISGPLRASGPCLHGKRTGTTRAAWLPGWSAGSRGRPCRVSSSAPSPGSDTTSSPAVANSSAVDTDQHSNVIDVGVQAMAPRSAAGPPSSAAPVPTPSGTVAADWTQPPPGDWGGAVDPQAIKEPDSSGLLFYFIIVAGLSLGVHQLLRLLGCRGAGEQLAQPSAAQVAVVAGPASRAKQPQQPIARSRPEASAEDALASTSTPATAAAQRTSAIDTRSEPEAGEDAVLVWDSRQADVDADVPTAAASVTRRALGEELRAACASGGGAGSSRAGASETEPGSDAEVQSENTAAEEPEQLGAVMRAQQQQQPSPPQQKQHPAAPGTAAQVSGAASPAGGPEEGSDWASASDAAKPLQQAPSGSSIDDPAVELLAGAQARIGMPGEPAMSQAQPSRQEGASGAAREAATSTGGGAGAGVGVFPSVRSAAPVPAERVGAAASAPGLGGEAPSGLTARSFSPFAGAGAFFMGGREGGAQQQEQQQQVPPLLLPQQQASPQRLQLQQLPEPASPVRVSLPTVRPEPLSRAPDSSALTHLPNDDSLGSLRERAQLALRAAAAAVEASQRAAAYAAAASSAASRAAEAAERAASAATLAQTGLETAAESAIVAAEARVAQAAEAAKDAEGRAASAAAHSTAYQDMSQSQADIAERAAAVHKPAAPGRLSQLQQLWRTASSAFVHAHPHDIPRGSGGSGDGPFSGSGAVDCSTTSSSRTTGGGDAGSCGRGGGSTSDAGGDTAAAGRMGSGAAETIKGLLSWLGQGDGTR